MHVRAIPLPATPVSLDDMTCKLILADNRFLSGMAFGTHTARKWVRHKLAGKGETDVQSRVHAAIIRAADAGVLRIVPLEEAIAPQIADEPADGNALTPRQHGRRVVYFQKRPWADIEGSQDAMDFVSAMGLSADKFT